MENNTFQHPAFHGEPPDQPIRGIVSAITRQDKRIKIISLDSAESRETIFIPISIFSLEILLGDCLLIEGEHRLKDYYGEIMVATKVLQEKPTPKIFYLFAHYHFPLCNQLTLKKIIDLDQESFCTAVATKDLDYFCEKNKLTRYIALKFLDFCQSHLDMRS